MVLTGEKPRVEKTRKGTGHRVAPTVRDFFGFLDRDANRETSSIEQVMHNQGKNARRVRQSTTWKSPADGR